MDYSRPDLADRLAAEYALGTLRGGARRRFEALLTAHPVLRQATRDWQARLMPLADALPPDPPSPAVWARVEQRLFAPAVSPAPQRVGWWQRLGLWQGAAGLATMAALALALVLVQPQPAPTVVVMAANAQAGAGAIPASFVASVSADGRALVLRPIDPVAIDADRQALELWAEPGTGAPRSLGLVSPRQVTTVERSGLRRDVAAYAVSLEPAGGSPTGQPTGPILALGKLQG